jgi:branched-chain amino acid transport system ATP-binding protein
MTPLIEARGLSAGYGGRPVVHDLDLAVGAGEVVCLLGPNGAGKTTTLLTMSGELPPLGGEVLFEGDPTTAPLYRRARAGLAYVTEERSVFKSLSGFDNLRTGGVTAAQVLELFPELERCLGTRGGLLSGGEQQMLTVGRALARSPRLLLADELSLGLAPIIVDRLLQAVRDAATERGMAVLLVEQHARKALRYADRVYVMRRGHIEMALTAEEAGRRISEIENVYLAISSAAAGASGSNGGTVEP